MRRWDRRLGGEDAGVAGTGDGRTNAGGETQRAGVKSAAESVGPLRGEGGTGGTGTTEGSCGVGVRTPGSGGAGTW